MENAVDVAATSPPAADVTFIRDSRRRRRRRRVLPWMLQWWRIAAVVRLSWERKATIITMLLQQALLELLLVSLFIGQTRYTSRVSGEDCQILGYYYPLQQHGWYGTTTGYSSVGTAGTKSLVALTTRNDDSAR
jgi:hypothetical protein